MVAETRPRWSDQTKLLVIVLFLVLVGYLLYKFQAVITPIILAIILAYVLSPLVNRIETGLRLRRGPAILVTYLLVFLIVGGLAALVTPLLLAQVRGISLDLNVLLQQLVRMTSQQYEVFGFTIDGRAIFNEIATSIRRVIEPLFSRSINFLASAMTSFVWVIFITIISIYLIRDSQRIGKWFLGLVPPGYEDDAIRLLQDINVIWSAFFRGQLTLALIMTTIITVVGFLIGLPFALAMGLLAGLMEFLPSIGNAIWLFVASLLALFFGSTWMPIPNWLFLIILVALHIIITQLDLNYIIPRVIGRSVNLPPLVVILGIITGAALAGVLGVVLAAPTIASLRVIGRYVYARLIDVDPFPVESVTTPLPPPNPRFWKRKHGASRGVKDVPDEDRSSAEN